MRAVLQRVTKASVTVDGKVVGAIAHGWLVLLGVGSHDAEEDATYLAEKTVNMRAFTDAEGKMNLSVIDNGGAVLVVSQFTLYGDCRKGRRPGFSDAAPPDRADALYRLFTEQVRQAGVPVANGQFQAHMQVELLNDGPVTLLLDSKRQF